MVFDVKYSVSCYIYVKQKHLGYKKARPIRSSSYLTTSLYIPILATKNFDIKVRPRIS